MLVSPSPLVNVTVSSCAVMNDLPPARCTGPCPIDPWSVQIAKNDGKVAHGLADFLLNRTLCISPSPCGSHSGQGRGRSSTPSFRRNPGLHITRRDGKSIHQREVHQLAGCEARARVWPI